MGNMFCGAPNTNKPTNLEEIIQTVVESPVKEELNEEIPIKVEEAINLDEVLQKVVEEEPKDEVLQKVVEEEPKEEVLQKVVEEEPKEEPKEELVKVEESVNLEEESLDDLVGSDSSSTTSSVNDTIPLITIEKVEEEPVKKKRGRKRKESSK